MSVSFSERENVKPPDVVASGEMFEGVIESDIFPWRRGSEVFERAIGIFVTVGRGAGASEGLSEESFDLAEYLNQ